MIHVVTSDGVIVPQTLGTAAILQQHSPSGSCWAHPRTVAEWMGVSERTARRRMRRLAAHLPAHVGYRGGGIFTFDKQAWWPTMPDQLRGLRDGPLTLWAEIARRCGRSGRWVSSWGRLAERLAVSERTVRRWADQLEARGVITVSVVRDRDGRVRGVAITSELLRRAAWKPASNSMIRWERPPFCPFPSEVRRPDRRRDDPCRRIPSDVLVRLTDLEDTRGWWSADGQFCPRSLPPPARKACKRFSMRVRRAATEAKMRRDRYGEPVDPFDPSPGHGGGRAEGGGGGGHRRERRHYDESEEERAARLRRLEALADFGPSQASWLTRGRRELPPSVREMLAAARQVLGPRSGGLVGALHRWQPGSERVADHRVGDDDTRPAETGRVSYDDDLFG